MRKNHQATLGVALAFSILSSAQPALAEINLNGFATIAGGMTLSEDESLNNYDDKFSFKNDSLIGLQLDSNMGEGLSATAQITSRGSEDWNADFEWAYISYEANDNLTFLFGRQRIPYYVYSDYLDVGYAYHWITPPENVYSVPLDSIDGIGANITNQIGNADSTLQLVYGRNQEDLGSGSSADGQNQLTIAWTLNYNWLTLRLGYAHTDLALEVADFEALAVAWSIAGFPEFTPYISGAEPDNASFIDAGLTIDNGSFLFTTEYTEVDIDGVPVADKTESYYASVGYRFGNVMPHITYGAAESTIADYSFLDSVPSGVNPGLDALIAGTTAAYNAAAREETYYIVGLRWDFHSSAAFKLEYMSQDDELTDESDTLVRFAISTVF